MAGTATVVSHPSVAYYSFTSTTGPADEVVTVGFNPIMAIAVIDGESAAPELAVSYNVAAVTQSFQAANHASAQFTSPVVASGISFSGRTLTVESALQNASGVNYLIIFGQ